MCKYRTKEIFIHVFSPLTIGGIIYLMFRSNTLRMFKWIEFIGLKSQVFSLREDFISLKQTLPSWVYFSLPDGLWVYSFSSSLIILWNFQFQKVKYWLLIPFMCSVLVEFLQYANLFPGTFDITDVVVCLSALIISKLILINYQFYYEKQVL